MLKAINYQITKAINLKSNGEEWETPDNYSAMTLSKDFKFNFDSSSEKIGDILFLIF